MKRHPLPALLLAFVALILAGNSAPRLARAAEKRPPNVILVLVDDLGATDLGCCGNRFHQTPHLDRLAAQGMRFTQAYSACTVCSPTRAAILTGKYPARLHLTDWIAGHQRPQAKLRPPDWTKHLPLEERTLAEALKERGYATATIGKWHLTEPTRPQDFTPEKQGFDLNIGGDQRGQPPSYHSPYRIPGLPDGPPGEFLTDREAAEAVKFIRQNRERPFFLYLPHYAVHTPIQAKATVIEKYRGRIQAELPHKNPAYAALLESVDDSIGTITAALEELKLTGETVLIFTSDNGGLLPQTANPGFRAGKGSAYEGGVRIPLIVRWPGVVRPGTECEVPVISVDHYPTLLEATGARLSEGQVVDGVNLMPLLRGRKSIQRDALFWHYPHYHPGGATPYSALREGDWRLLEFYEDGRTELYNLKSDPEEKQDLAAEKPDQVRRLKTRLDKWRKSVDAQDPLPNDNAR